MQCALHAQCSVLGMQPYHSPYLVFDCAKHGPDFCILAGLFLLLVDHFPHTVVELLVRNPGIFSGWRAYESESKLESSPDKNLRTLQHP